MRTTLIALCAALLLAGAASAQSLGQVAADEAARRKAIQRPARVITADDLRPAEVAPAAPSTAAAGAAEADPATRRVVVSPARLQGGSVPGVPPQGVAGGEVLLEVEVTAEGAVGTVTPLRVTPPFAEMLSRDVKGWRFRPAEDAAAPGPDGRIDPSTRAKVATRTMVIGLFRPPAIFQGTIGEAPKNVGSPSDAVPAPQGRLTMPGYPPQALFDGVVLLELSLKADGTIASTNVVRSAAPFDTLVLEAVKDLSFRPPRVHGAPAPSSVYVVAMFRQPLTR